MTLLCTAGHVDHGKSALVRALTGTDPDRLAEEKRRGMTIELGFAEWRLPTGASLSLIDTPGHERLIRTMAAGAHAVDGVLLVVAAQEGVKPQTREHLDICQLLGPRPVVAVISMADRVDSALVEQRAAEVAQLAQQRSVELAGVVACSAVTGAGLDTLGELVASQFSPDAARPQGGEPRLHVDRAFLMTGQGVVVTGTLIDGPLRTGDTVRVLPGGAEAKVRRLERHGEVLDTAQPGSRTAVNLHGIARVAIARGDTLVRSRHTSARTLFGASVRLLPEIELSSAPEHHVTLHHGTRSCLARLTVLGGEPLAAGATGFADLRTSLPIVAIPGDRFLLRSTSAEQTLGGGVILDVAPASRRRPVGARVNDLVRRGDGSASAVISAEIERAPEGLGLEQLSALTGLSVDALIDLTNRLEGVRRVALTDGERLVSDVVAGRAQAAILAALTEFHRAFPSLAGMEVGALRKGAGGRLAAPLIEALIATGEVRVAAPGLVALHAWSADTVPVDALLQWIQLRALEPATPADIRATGFRDDQLRSLINERRVVHLGGGFVARSRLEAAATLVWRHLSESGPAPAGVLCRVLGVSRRVGIPLLEHLDAQGVTRREGDQRSAGWREREGNDPSEDVASTPPSRFEDGGAHLDPSTPATTITDAAVPGSGDRA